MSEQPEISKITDALGDAARAFDLLTERVRPAMVQATLQKDAAISEALATIQPAWTAEEIRRRCVIIRSVGDQLEQLFVDGILVLKLFPPEFVQEWRDDRLVITITQKFSRVRAAKL